MESNIPLLRISHLPVGGIRGITLIELVVTIAVLAVAVAIAVPSYNTLITTNRIASEVNELVASLQYARREAVRRGLDGVFKY